jgi:hypothetical protein
MHTRTWHVEVYISEGDEGRTVADAVLRTDAGTELRHTGVARRRPSDPEIAEIGDELAACRALSGLAQDLLEATVLDVGANVGSAVELSG